MEEITLEANTWFISEGPVPAYYIYEMLKGKVSVYSNGAKVNEMEVKEGGEPVFLGIIAAMSRDRFNTASVRADTDIVVKQHSIDQVWGILQNEIPAEVRDGLMTMVNAIAIKNNIEQLKARLESVSKVKAQIPTGMKPDAQAILNEIGKLYDDIVK